MKNKIIILLTLCLSLSSCFEADNAVTPYDRGDVNTNQIEMNSNYENQIYFDMSSNTQVSSNKYGDWDLGFQSFDSYYIRQNTARVMNIVDLGEVNFDEVNENTALGETLIDVPSGNLDSTAIGKWWVEIDNGNVISKNHIYVIDRGSSHDRKSKKSKKVKMKILGANESEFTIIFAEFGSTIIDTVKIKRIENRNFVTFSFDDGGKVNDLEPPSDSWDLLFTRYVELFDVEGFEVYPVTGVLINTRYCLVAEGDSTVDFKEITANSISELKLTNKRDEVGYDWKIVDINTGVYTLNPSKKYIIKDTEGFYYKLRFTSFYKVINENVEKGYPEIEFKLL